MLLGLVGGLGSRPWPLTACPNAGQKKLAAVKLNANTVNANALPKPLSPLGTVPLMLPLFSSAVRSCGIEDIAMALMYMPDDIRTYFGPNMERLRKGTGSSFFWEHQKEFNLNTAGCLVKGWQEDLKGRSSRIGTFIILSADIRSAAKINEMLEHHNRYNALVSIGLAPVPWKEVGRFGVVYRDGDVINGDGKISKYSGGKYSRITRFQEKNPDAASNLNNSSIYIVDKLLFELIEDDIEITENRNQLDRRLSSEQVLKLNPYGLPIPQGKFDHSRGNYVNDWTDPNTGKHYRLGVFSTILRRSLKIKEGEANANFQDWGGHVFPDITSQHPEIYESKEPSAPRGIYGYIIDGLWADDGTRRAMYEANFELLTGLGGFNRRHDFDWWPKPHVSLLDDNSNQLWLGENLHIEEGARIVGPAIIGNNVTIRRGAVIERSVIGEGWTIDGNTALCSSVLWPGRESLGLPPLDPRLIFTLSNLAIDHSIIGGGFYGPAAEVIFNVDIGGNYLARFSGASRPHFENVVIVPSPAQGGMSVVPLE